MNMTLNVNINVSLNAFSSAISAYSAILLTIMAVHLTIGQIIYTPMAAISHQIILNSVFMCYPFTLVMLLLPTYRLLPITGTNSTGIPKPFSPAIQINAVPSKIPLAITFNTFNIIAPLLI